MSWQPEGSALLNDLMKCGRLSSIELVYVGNDSITVVTGSTTVHGSSPLRHYAGDTSGDAVRPPAGSEASASQELAVLLPMGRTGIDSKSSDSNT